MEDSLLFNRVLFVFLTTSTTRHIIITNMFIIFNQTEKENFHFLFLTFVDFEDHPKSGQGKPVTNLSFFLNNNKKKNLLCQSYR